jgi:N-hydroxyarylamine O-acetyltransferase
LWLNTVVDIEAYLKRINYSGPRDVTPETLRALQVAHLMSVPFENLSIHSGEPIVLEDEALFSKIVENRRGGFCYEANGLFASLLRALGFKVEMLSAGVAHREGGFGPDFDHMILMVTLDQRWLVDVGFGESFVEPLLLDERGEQIQRAGSFRIDADNDYLILQRRDQGGDWLPQYRFTLEPHTFADYEAMCHYHQTSPDSHFTKAPLCSLATPDGRVTLTGMRLITTAGKLRDEQTLSSREEFDRLLNDQFGVVMKNKLEF